MTNIYCVLKNEERKQNKKDLQKKKGIEDKKKKNNKMHSKMNGKQGR